MINNHQLQPKKSQELFGQASLDASALNTAVKKNFFNFTKDKRSFVLRILPPFGSQKNNPLGWVKFWPVHFGYTDTQGRMRPFASPFKKRDGIVVVRDPALERIEKLEKQLTYTQDPVKRAELEELLRRFNLSKKWYLNVVDLEGNIGLFAIPHKMKLALEAELKRLQQEGHEPLSLDKGLFLEFAKEGTGRDTVHKVQVYMETVTVNGKKYRQEKYHVIDEEFLAKAAKYCFDLGMLYPTPTPEEIEAIVNDDTGQVLEQVLAKYTTNATTTNGSESDAELEQAKQLLNQTAQFSTESSKLSADDSGDVTIVDYDALLEEAIRG